MGTSGIMTVVVSGISPGGCQFVPGAFGVNFVKVVSVGNGSQSLNWTKDVDGNITIDSGLIKMTFERHLLTGCVDANIGTVEQDYSLGIGCDEAGFNAGGGNPNKPEWLYSSGSIDNINPNSGIWILSNFTGFADEDATHQFIDFSAMTITISL